MNLDIRDLNFWVNEARKKMIRDQLNKIILERTAHHATHEDFRRALFQLEINYDILDQDEEKYERAWKELEKRAKK